MFIWQKEPPAHKYHVVYHGLRRVYSVTDAAGQTFGLTCKANTLYPFQSGIIFTNNKRAVAIGFMVKSDLSLLHKTQKM
jgi:YD repeat-containing protein